jgi:hypothetical protein
MGRVDDAFDRVLGGSVAIKHLLRSSDDLARPTIAPTMS